MKKLKNLFRDLSIFERILWITSLVVVTVSFLCVPDKDYLTLACSLIGVTALIFVAKGYVIGQILCIVFAVFYGIISFHFKYYGEMITYLGMSAPMAVAATVSWIRHPHKESKSVEIHKLKKYQIALMVALTIIVTTAFYFILNALGTQNIVFSTISVTTSLVAVYLTFMRSPYYAIGYALNDIVLIVLWVLASIENPSYVPMILCFIMFLANDLYGFINWKRMEKAQKTK